MSFNDRKVMFETLGSFSNTARKKKEGRVVKAFVSTVAFPPLTGGFRK